MVIDEAAPAPELSLRRGEDTGFDVNLLKERGLGSAIGEWLGAHPLWVFALLRRFRPIVRIPSANVVVVTRFDDVQEVLQQQQVFHVPYGEKVKELNGGPNFMLGLEDGDEYRRYRKLVMQVFRVEDVRDIVVPEAARLAQQILDRSGGRIDAVEGLLTRVANLLCGYYYGLTLPDDVVAFGHWALAMSTHVFVDATKTVPLHQQLAEAAAARTREVVQDSIAEARKRRKGPDTVLTRLVALQSTHKELTDDVILSIMIGMVTGFVPTNTLAAGHILDMLLSRPDFMANARAAAVAGDDDLLRRCLFEALRFRHIHFGLTRVCAQDYTIAAGTRRARTVRAGEFVLASTWSAMFDERRIAQPHRFNPARNPGDYMLFGYGLHWCVGAYIAQAQITQTFKALLVKGGLHRAPGKDGQLQLLGFFPQHLVVEFDASLARRGCAA